MNRSTARRHAFILIYQIPFHAGCDEAEAASLADSYFEELPDCTEKDRAFITGEFYGVRDNLQAADELISSHCEGWTLERINKTDLAVMRLAVYEMLFMRDIPVSVSINEAVELARSYGIDESAAFVNSVLGKIAAGIKKGSSDE